MKLIGRIYMLLIIMVLISACSNKDILGKYDIVWIDVAMSSNKYLFKINNNSIEVVSGGVLLDTGAKTIQCVGDVKVKTIKPNSQDRKVINELLLKIGEKGVGLIHPGNDTTEIFAVINEKTYWAPSHDGAYANKELLDLTYKLIELSSIDMSGAYDPITVPK